jgi:hypothetical protein
VASAQETRRKAGADRKREIELASAAFEKAQAKTRERIHALDARKAEVDELLAGGHEASAGQQLLRELEKNHQDQLAARRTQTEDLELFRARIGALQTEGNESLGATISAYKNVGEIRGKLRIVQSVTRQRLVLEVVFPAAYAAVAVAAGVFAGLGLLP